jgi:hypothetical protein
MSYLNFIATPAAGGPTAWFLDTFTAANGTDPLSRKCDIYPTEWDYWKTQAAGPTQFGEIQNNRFVVELDDGRAIVQNYNSGETRASTNLPYFILLEADAGTVDVGDFVKVNISNSVVFTQCQLVMYAGGDVDAYAYSDIGGYWEMPRGPYVNIGTGTHKVGLYISTEEITVFADGTEIGSGVVASIDGSITYLVLDIFNVGFNDSDGTVDKVAIYQDITPAEAQALTA